MFVFTNLTIQYEFQFFFINYNRNQIDINIELYLQKKSIMENFLKINTEPAANGDVHFIVNKDRKNYVNLGGFNSDDVIDCVHQFMCTYDIWSENDKVIKCPKKYNFVPSSYHNISFVISFYNKARASKKYSEQIHNVNSDHIEHDEFNDDTGLNVPLSHKGAPHITVKHLTNPNISHDVKPTNTKQNKEASRTLVKSKDDNYYDSHTDNSDSDILDDVDALLDSDDASESDSKPAKKDKKSTQKTSKTINVNIDTKVKKDSKSKKNKSESEVSEPDIGSNSESESDSNSIYSGSDISAGSNLSDEDADLDDMDDIPDLDSDESDGSDIEVNLKVKKNTKKTFPKSNAKQNSKAKSAVKPKKSTAKNAPKTKGKTAGKKTGGKKGK